MANREFDDLQSSLLLIPPHNPFNSFLTASKTNQMLVVIKSKDSPIWTAFVCCLDVPE